MKKFSNIKFRNFFYLYTFCSNKSYKKNFWNTNQNKLQLNSFFPMNLAWTLFTGCNFLRDLTNEFHSDPVTVKAFSNTISRFCVWTTFLSDGTIFGRTVVKFGSTTQRLNQLLESFTDSISARLSMRLFSWVKTTWWYGKK